ncbi:peptidylprolyl isomerase [Pseudorhodoferax sp.]|uniref:peptidylprolyl isomerase n=1 Tax=Pseudorhodoferax sp. TaxID=1993553 RepID=UPI002DD634D7|nr:peptidylprolyl isomerase [Pseudorhodoferax sp.]
MTIFSTPSRAVLLCAGLLLSSSVAFAQSASPALVATDKAAIRAADVRSEFSQAAPEQRSAVLERSDRVAQVAKSLLVRRVLAQQAEGLSLAGTPEATEALRIARETVLAEAMVDRLAASKLSDKAAIEAQARAAYEARQKDFQLPERVRVRHILVLAKAGDTAGTAAAEKKANELLAQLKAGADFAKLASEQSGDYASAQRGGDLGLFARDEMVAEFSQAAFALKSPGDLAGPVRTAYGFHVLQLVEKKAAGRRPFEEVREQLLYEVRMTVRGEVMTEASRKVDADAKLDAAAVQAFVDSQRGAKP